jgi:hypothetical protein
MVHDLSRWVFVFVFAERRLRLNEARSDFVRCIVKLNNVAFAMFGRKRVEGHMYTCTKITAQNDRQLVPRRQFQTEPHEWWVIPPVESGRLQMLW